MNKKIKMKTVNTEKKERHSLLAWVGVLSSVWLLIVFFYCLFNTGSIIVMQWENPMKLSAIERLEKLERGEKIYVPKNYITLRDLIFGEKNNE